MSLARPLPEGVAAGRSAPATLRALEALLPAESRDFAVRLWSGEILSPTPGYRPRFTLVLRHPAALRRMLWPPSELTVADAFIRGDFDVEGDLVAAFRLREAFSPSRRTLLQLLRVLPAAAGDAAASAPLPHAAALHGRAHTPSRDATAVRHHYDLGNDFFALWLDRRMVYSCAYFPRPDAPLEAAQEAKLELVCRKLRLRSGERLLDVGCGWGALVLHAVQRHGVRALGITLSPAQAELARARIAEARLGDRCRVEIMDYRALSGEFDKIVSVGMVEHVGRRNLPGYFEKLAARLRPGGVLLNHGIAGNEPEPPALTRLVKGRGKFLQRYVFPDADLPHFHVAARAAHEAGLELRDVESLREHYALTLRHWLTRLERSHAAAARAVGEEVYRTWRLYLAGSAFDFDQNALGVYQALFVKPDRGVSGLPLGREGWYGKHLVPPWKRLRKEG
jgi:cyclopropane-fatty-acyl-phospholipid synthase